jgi:hypothetical protein
VRVGSQVDRLLPSALDNAKGVMLRGFYASSVLSDSPCESSTPPVFIAGWIVRWAALGSERGFRSEVYILVVLVVTIYQILRYLRVWPCPSRGG